MSEFEQKIAQMMLQTVEQNRLAAELRSQAEEERIHAEKERRKERIKNDAELAELRSQAEEERRKERIQEEEERRKERIKNDAELAELRRQGEEARLKNEAELVELRRQGEETRLKNEAKLAKLREQAEDAKKQRDKAIDNLTKQVNGYIDNESMIQEDEFAEALREEMQIGDIVLTEVMTRQKSGREYDLLAINGEAVVVGEVKHRLNVRDVKRFVAKALPDFVNHFPKYAGFKIYGMVAGDIINKEADAEAKKSGLFVLRLKNKSLLVSNVKGAKPIG